MKIGNKKDRHMFKNGRARPELKNRRSVCSCMSQGSSNESLKQKMMTAQKMKLSIESFFSKCDRIRRNLQIWSYLLKKSLIENFVRWKMNTLSCERRPIRQHIRNIIYRSFIRCFSQYSFEMVELG